MPERSARDGPTTNPGAIRTPRDPHYNEPRRDLHATAYYEPRSVPHAGGICTTALPTNPGGSARDGPSNEPGGIRTRRDPHRRDPHPTNPEGSAPGDPHPGGIRTTAPTTNPGGIRTEGSAPWRDPHHGPATNPGGIRRRDPHHGPYNEPRRDPQEGSAPRPLQRTPEGSAGGIRRSGSTAGEAFPLLRALKDAREGPFRLRRPGHSARGSRRRTGRNRPGWLSAQAPRPSSCRRRCQRCTSPPAYRSVAAPWWG